MLRVVGQEAHVPQGLAVLGLGVARDIADLQDTPVRHAEEGADKVIGGLGVGGVTHVEVNDVAVAAVR